MINAQKESMSLQLLLAATQCNMTDLGFLAPAQFVAHCQANVVSWQQHALLHKICGAVI